MIEETNLEKDEMTFHFVPEIGANSDTLGDDVREYVGQFLTKLCSGYGVEPTSISLVGDLPTLTNIIGVVVQDYYHFKNRKDERFTAYLSS
ncbi:MAG TPA: hypothetical protein DD806_03475 [Flavobacterium sp.]|nr:hypothetical protein [Flavobacterium sp.]